jgi:hypothetical protein
MGAGDRLAPGDQDLGAVALGHGDRVGLAVGTGAKPISGPLDS